MCANRSCGLGILLVAGLLIPVSCDRPEPSPPPSLDISELVIITPHGAMIREAFADGFRRWQEDNKLPGAITIRWIHKGTLDCQRHVYDRYAQYPESSQRRIGIDVFWGGGIAVHRDVTARGFALPVKLSAKALEGIPAELNGQPLYAPDGSWHGTALGGLLVGLACCSMLTGNVLALRQSYGKRLLGYSTVAQVGYMAAAMGLGMAYEQPALLAAGLLLLVAHGLLKGVAFLAKGMLHLYCNATTLDDLDGLGRLAPFASGHLAAVLVGLAGVPPLAGFVAKFSVLWGLAGAGSGLAYAVGAFYLVNSLVSLGYYLPLIGRLARGTAVQSATAAQDDTSSSRPSLWMRAPVAGLTLLAVLLGVCPGPVWRLAEQTAAYLLAWGS